MRHLVLKNLSERLGTYQGQGINHENQNFHGVFRLSSALESQALSIDFTARAESNGSILHQEHSLIAPSLEEGLGLWMISTNTPGMILHRLRREEVAVDGVSRVLVFGYGDPSHRHSFREEITLELWENGDIGYRYAWGMPGGEFSPRSSVRMRAIR